MSAIVKCISTLPDKCELYAVLLSMLSNDNPQLVQVVLQAALKALDSAWSNEWRKCKVLLRFFMFASNEFVAICEQ